MSVCLFSAYEILSDEEKRKNYDLYGDEKGNPGFDPGHPGGGGGGYTHFTSGGPGSTFRPGEWQTMDGSGGFNTFSYSFGGSNPFDSFDLGDIFSGFFQGGQYSGFKGSGQSGGFKSSGQSAGYGSTGQSAGFKNSAGSQFGSRSSTKSSIRTVSSQVFKNEITGQGMTWLLLFKAPGLRDNEYYESLIEEVGNSLQGVMKVH